MTDKSLIIDLTGFNSLTVNAKAEDLKNRGTVLPIMFSTDSDEEQEIIAQIDTGTGHSSISPLLAKKLQAAPVGEAYMHPAGQEPVSVPTYRGTITIGTGTVINADFAVLPSLHEDYDALIGTDILCFCKIVIDFTTGQWSLHFKINGNKKPAIKPV